MFLEVLYQTYKQREQQKSLKFANFIETKCYRGWRLLFHLPLYGQNTHNNRNTRKRFNIL